MGVSEVGDRSSAGENLIMAGAKNKDGLTIKAGVLLLKSIGLPIYMIVEISRYLVKEARKK